MMEKRSKKRSTLTSDEVSNIHNHISEFRKEVRFVVWGLVVMNLVIGLLVLLR